MITIVPYVQAVDGWTVPDEVVKATFDKFVQDGTVNQIFYDGNTNNREAFFNFMRNPNNVPQWILVDQIPSGVCWLNGMGPGYAFAHYGLFKETWGKTTEDIAKECQKYWFSMQNNGEYLLDILLGMTPTFNRKAAHFLNKIGWTILGEIPNLHYVPHLGRKTSILISYKQRT